MADIPIQDPTQLATTPNIPQAPIAPDLDLSLTRSTTTSDGSTVSSRLCSAVDLEREEDVDGRHKKAKGESTEKGLAS